MVLFRYGIQIQHMNHQSFRISQLSTTHELELAYSILLELRPELSRDDFIAVYNEAAARDQYQIVGLFADNTLAGVMGFRVLLDYVHGKHVYVDDLVVTEKSRSKGAGAYLLNFAEDFARQNQCKKIRLCTGIDNEKGKRFYEREGWNVRAVVFKKTIGPSV